MSQKYPLQRHVLAQQRNYPEATGEFTDLLLDLIVGIKSIAHAVRRGGISQRTADSSRHSYSQEEMAEFAQRRIYEAMDHGGHLCWMSSRRISDPIPIPQKYPKGKYILGFDPFESAPSSGAGTPSGSLFSIFQKQSESPGGTEEDLFQTGKKQVAAGYVLYGPTTILVYTSGTGVHSFILDEVTGEFIRDQTNLTIEDSLKVLSFNASEMIGWSNPNREFLQNRIQSGATNKECISPYTGSVIWDAHQVLMRGGIYFRPIDHDDTHHPHGKLRLLHHCFPLGMIFEQAGGKATDGESSIMDLEPQDLHQRSALFLGSKGIIDEYLETS